MQVREVRRANDYSMLIHIAVANGYQLARFRFAQEGGVGVFCCCGLVVLFLAVCLSKFTYNWFSFPQVKFLN